RAALVLEGTSYHQQGRALDTYVDEFKKLVRRSDFPQSTQLVLQFRQGLDQLICRHIDGMVEGRPRDNNLDSCSIVRLIDQNAYADRQFESSHPSKLCPSAPPAPAPLQALAPPVRAPAAPLAAPKLSMGVPMDIDAARRKGTLPASVCHCCGKPGHWARDCPEGFGVRYLSSEERGVLITELLAAEDAAGVPSPEILTESLEEATEPAEEDF
ncbi:hypothetical protein H0H92_013331, partial [Tricholoma furcatifolium]